MAAAERGKLFYLVGGDPGIVPKILDGSPVWDAIVAAWRGGAALAGSSAGAMALGEWTLIRDRMPGDDRRRYADALGLLPGVAVLPHFDTFGHRWVDSALAGAPEGAVLLGPDERTGAVWHGHRWRVLGDGSVTVITAVGTPDLPRRRRDRRPPRSKVIERSPSITRPTTWTGFRCAARVTLPEPNGGGPSG